MAFGTPVAAAAAYSTAGGTTVSPAYPAGILATDAVLLFVGQKPSTANGGTVTTPTGWTLRDELLAAGGYGATLAADQGNTNLRVYSWNTPVAGQTGNLAVTLGTNDISWAFIVRIPTGDGGVGFGSADGQRTTTPTSPMSIALTNGATATNFQAGDLAIWAMCIPTDVTTPAQFSAQSITATGATFATAVELNEPDSNLGNDIGGYSAYATVSSGSSTTAPTVTVTLAGTLTNVRGPVVLLRIRETTQTLTQGTRFTNTPEFFGPTAQATNSVTPALFTNTPQFYSPTVSLAVDQTLTQGTSFTNTPQFFAATSVSPVTLSQVSFGPSNLLSWSEQLDIASGWSLGTAVTVTTDTVVAPDGTTTADTLTYTGGNGTRYLRKFITGRPLQYYTYSIYVKKNNYRYVGIRPCSLGPGVGSGQEHCVFDFDTETFVYTPPTSGIISTGFTNVGNGWYRIYATSQFSISSSFTARVASIAITDSLGFEQGGTLPANGSEVYAWGAQLELSTAVSAYIKTTSTAPVQQQVPNVFFSPTLTSVLTPALYENTPQFFTAAATTTNTLTPALYTNTPQFFTATAVNANTVAPALYTNTPQFFTATAVNANTVAPALFTNTPQFFTATLTQTSASQNLAPALFTNTPQFFAVTVTSSNTLAPALYINTPQFFSASIAQTDNVFVYWLEVEQLTAQNLTPALYTNTPQFYAHTLTAANTLFPALYTNTPQFFSSLVTSAATLLPALYTNTPQFFSASILTSGNLVQTDRFTNTPQFFAHTLTPGAVSINPALFTNTPQFFAQTLTATNTLTPALFTNTPQFFTATLTRANTLTPALYTNTPQFFSHTLTATNTLTPALYTNTPQFYTPTVAGGAVNLAPALYTNTPQFFTPTVAQGPVVITPALFTNTPQFFTAAITVGPVTLLPQRFTNTPTVYAPTVVPPGVTLQPQRLNNTPAFFTHTLTASNTLTPPLLVNQPAFFSATVTTGPVTLLPQRFDNQQIYYTGLISADQLVIPSLYTNQNTFFPLTAVGFYNLSIQDYVDSGYVEGGYVEFVAFNQNQYYPFTSTVGAVVLVNGNSGTGLVGEVNFGWTVIDDNQTANWQNVDDSQTSNWVPVVSSQTSNWQSVPV